MSEESKDRDRLEQMQRELDSLQKEKDEIALVLPGRGDGSTALPEDHLASEATVEEIERAKVVRDPWAGQNAMKILVHPPGKHLQWISPDYRERRGMRGWTAVRYDDAIGRELHRYVTDPPSRMEGLVELGSVVRRGDVVLAWIDEGIFQSRILKGQEKANRNLRKGAGRGNQRIGEHGQSTDDGLRDDSNPRYRTRPGTVSPRRLEEYRENAKGTVEDQRITVEGRRLFPD
jgi:hypothetical protein